MPAEVELTADWMRSFVGYVLSFQRGRTQFNTAFNRARSSGKYRFMSAEDASQAYDYARGAWAATARARQQHFGGHIGTTSDYVGIRLYVPVHNVDAAGNPIPGTERGIELALNVTGLMSWQSLLEHVAANIGTIAYQNEKYGGYHVELAVPISELQPGAAIRQILPYGHLNPVMPELAQEVPF